MLKNLFLFGLLILGSGCMHSIHEVHAGDMSIANATKGKLIKAKSEQFVFMGFVQQTDYVNQAREKLMAECPNAPIEGIVTQYSTSLGFLSWHNKILMQGYCVQTAAHAAKAATKPRQRARAQRPGRRT